MLLPPPYSLPDGAASCTLKDVRRLLEPPPIVEPLKRLSSTDCSRRLNVRFLIVVLSYRMLALPASGEGGTGSFVLLFVPLLPALAGSS